MKHLQKIFLVLITASLFNACNTTEPPSNQTLTLKLEDVSCTEAWIQLTTNNLQLPTTINILKNNTVAQTFSLSTKDSLLYIDSLLPNQNYSFQVSSIEYPVSPGGTGNISSNKLTVTTMDTTSHNFTWQTFTFGDAGAGSSTLYDVAIIDENNIWAVGEIYMLDSLGRPDPNAYNAVHWDGTKWELKRIPIYLGSGFPFYPVIKSIFAFSENNIWFEAGIHWDGISFKQVPFNIQWNGNVNKLWGSSSSDLYAVGNNGNIAHWDGVRWKKIESGTTLNINDIWGIQDNKSNNLIYCPAYNLGSGGEKKLIKIENNKVSEVNWNQNLGLYTCWFNTPNKIYAGGDGLFYNVINKWEEINLPTYFKFSIRGSGFNNIFTVGGYGFVSHFNGLTWEVYPQLSLPLGNYKALSVKQNCITIISEMGRIVLGQSL